MAPVEPVYGLTEGLYPRTVQKAARGRARAPAGAARMDRRRGALPRSDGLPFAAALKRAARADNRPPTSSRPAPRARRLAYDELLASQLALLMVRARMRESRRAARSPSEGRARRARARAALPYRADGRADAAPSPKSAPISRAPSA